MKRFAIAVLVSLLAGCGTVTATRASSSPPVKTGRSPAVNAFFEYLHEHSTFIVGDSLTVLNAPYIKADFGQFRPTQIACWIGTTISSWIPYVHQQVEAQNKEFPPTAIVALGTNDYDYQSTNHVNVMVGNSSAVLGYMFTVQAMINQFPPTERVFFVNTAAQVGSPWWGEQDEALKASIESFIINLDHSKGQDLNVHIIDWASVVNQPANQGWYVDGLHVNATGDQARAQLELQDANP